jgi:hypothetical protein
MFCDEQRKGIHHSESGSAMSAADVVITPKELEDEEDW